MAKLTLSIPLKSVKAARKYAKSRRTSISSLVTRLFQSFESSERRESERRLTPITHSCLGIITLPRIKKADLISEALAIKHLKK